MEQPEDDDDNPLADGFAMLDGWECAEEKWVGEQHLSPELDDDPPGGANLIRKPRWRKSSPIGLAKLAGKRGWKFKVKLPGEPGSKATVIEIVYDVAWDGTIELAWIGQFELATMQQYLSEDVIEHLREQAYTHALNML